MADSESSRCLSRRLVREAPPSNKACWATHELKRSSAMATNLSGKVRAISLAKRSAPSVACVFRPSKRFGSPKTNPETGSSAQICPKRVITSLVGIPSNGKAIFPSVSVQAKPVRFSPKSIATILPNSCIAIQNKRFLWYDKRCWARKLRFFYVSIIQLSMASYNLIEF